MESRVVSCTETEQEVEEKDSKLEEVEEAVNIWKKEKFLACTNSLKRLKEHPEKAVWNGYIEWWR